MESGADNTPPKGTVVTNPLEDSKGVLRYAIPEGESKAPEIAIALHFVELDVKDDKSSTKDTDVNVFTSLEMDLLAYQFQIGEKPALWSTVTSKRAHGNPERKDFINLHIEFPETYSYHTEGTTYWRKGKSKIKAELRLSHTDFQSGVRVWHCVISPAMDESFSEFEIIKLIHLYDGRSESTKLSSLEKPESNETDQRIKFNLPDLNKECVGARDLLSALGVLQETESNQNNRSRSGAQMRGKFIAGTIQLNPDAEHRPYYKWFREVPKARSDKDSEAKLAQLKETLGKSDDESRTILALAGIVTGIFDFENVRTEELLDTLEPTYSDGEIFLRINRCTLIGYIPDDRVMKTEKVHKQIGISPYLLLPHAAIIHNEALVCRGEKTLDDLKNEIFSFWRAPSLFRRSRALSTIEVFLESASAYLSEWQLQNVFNYVTERTLFEKGMKARGVVDKREAIIARLKDAKEQVESIWKFRAEWGQTLIAAILAAISVNSAKQLLAPIYPFKSEELAAAFFACGAIILFWFVIWVRGAGVRIRHTKIALEASKPAVGNRQ